jgi:hypothetical protein
MPVTSDEFYTSIAKITFLLSKKDPEMDPDESFRIQIRPGQKVPDQTGSGSATLLLQCFVFAKSCIVKKRN